MRPSLFGTIASVLLILAAVPASAAETLTGPATIVDGDTLKLSGERIRLHGIDAPEMDQTCQWPGRMIECGVISKSALQDLTAGVTITCEGTKRDRYGRIIARCYDPQGADINRNMAWTGWALAYRRYSLDYVGAEEEAKEAKRGMWRGEFVEPWEWRRLGRQ